MTSSVADRFHIAGPAAPVPPVDGLVIYADGAQAPDTAAGASIDLSHWVPNTTDARYKADTSTEICCNYAADPDRTSADLVVNDHVDIDGVLSLYSLVHSATALEHREALVAAASMGDFLAWPGRTGFTVAQSLAVELAASRALDPTERYRRAFAVVDAVLDGAPVRAEVSSGWSSLESQRDRLDTVVDVSVIGDRFVAFTYPRLDGEDRERAVNLGSMNQVVDDSVWLWPQVRNLDYGQRVQLVAIPGDGGWFYDLWLPGYAWAETPNRWAVPGLKSTGDSNVWLLRHPPLTAAVDELNRRETRPGTWAAAERLTPFLSMPGRQFPIVAAFVDDGRPVESGLGPDVVTEALAHLW